MRFIAFERSRGHCQVDLLQGDGLTQALAQYLVAHWRVIVDERGWIHDGDFAEHPLEFIEREIKADPDNDELAVDMESCETVHESSFEIRVLPEGALDAACASVLTSAEPANVSGEIMKARLQFARDYPDVDARAIFWYVREGVLVTFVKLDVTEEGRNMDVIARYLAGNHDPWTVERWSGTYEELAEQMTFEFPYC